MQELLLAWVHPRSRGEYLRAEKYMHWWTFLGYFMEVEDGLFSQVLSIRQKKARHKKLEKWEDKEGEVWLSDHYPVCVVLELE